MEAVAGTNGTEQTTTGSAAVKVALLDDERIFRDSLTVLLGSFGIEVVCSTGDARELMELVRRHELPLAIMGLPHGVARDGAGVLRNLVEVQPQLRSVVVSTSADHFFASACYDAGAWAFLHRSAASASSLVAAVNAVSRGTRLTPELAPARFNEPMMMTRGGRPRLTAREREVLALVGTGADNLKIAATLSISERTVKSHMASLYQKLAAENRVQLALRAREVAPPPPME